MKNEPARRLLRTVVIAFVLCGVGVGCDWIGTRFEMLLFRWLAIAFVLAGIVVVWYCVFDGWRRLFRPSR